MILFLLVLTVGTVGMIICALIRRKRFSLSVLKCVIFALLLTAVGVAGTKLLYFIESGFSSWDGVSFFGSVFLIPLVMPLVGLPFRQKPSQSLDICAPCVAVMIACMRVSCYISGCCGGVQACIGTFCFNWPTQIIESFCDVLILYWLMKREEKIGSDGRLYPYFMIMYSFMRFFIEFLRNTPKDWLMLSHGQWFCMAAILGALVWLFLLKRRRTDT